MVDATFDTYAVGYAETVNDSVRFAGQTVEFFTAAKVRELLRTARSLGVAPDTVRVLDVGCGPGLADRLLLPHVASVDGVDVSAGMVALAAARNPAATYRVYEGDRLPFADGQFHLVFASCVLHHVPPRQWHQFLAELWRVTARPGAAVVIEHNPGNPLTRRAVRACPFDADAVLASPRQVLAAFRRLEVPMLSRKYVTFIPVDHGVARRAEDFLGWLPAGAQYVVTAAR